MKVGFIDADKKNEKKPFPNLALMKLSAWHKANGDSVGWYDGSYCDKVYISKVFSFSPDIDYIINAGEVVRGGSGYAIKLINGLEVYDKSKDPSLPYEIEHIYPDYSLYGITDTAYGYMARGCPRGCGFCHVARKEGLKSTKVADLSEFWSGQKNIEICDPNTLACRDWKEILQQLIDSGACVDFNQGVDIRLMTEEKAEMFKRIKLKNIHFAWDRFADGDSVLANLAMFKRITGLNCRKIGVFLLTNFDTTFEQDLERILTLREDYSPYVMIYDKEHLPRGSRYRNLQTWVNYRPAFKSFSSFEDFEYFRKHRKR